MADETYNDPHGATCETFEEAREQSFRRGFNQGIAAAIEAFQKGYSVGQMEEWNERVYEWRGESHKGEIVYPEWLARENKVKPDLDD